GKVLSVGDGKRLDSGERAPFSVKKGDEVIFTSYAGTEVKIDGEELMIMSEDDILAIVE
ncbi:MAG: co-chaperone GroES, partial [Planctomycetes bacterium]|nr:co-chaperone GroES [Planctomycetota bacterium]